jgi:tRNA A37 threonylcarbamoyladenosine biosynthesis protein TsaE
MDSLADIVLRFKLASVDTAFICEGTGTLLRTHILHYLLFHYDIYKLSPMTLSSIQNRLVNNSFVIDWVHQQYSSAANETKYNVKIGFSKSKAKRLIMVPVVPHG